MPDRSPLALAALGCAAVSGLEPVTARRVPTHDRDLDAALVGDSLQRQWLVRAPRTTAAAVRLSQESVLLHALVGKLPFAVPEVAGTALLPEGSRALVQRALPGRPLDPAALAPGTPATAALGRALAAVHELPPGLAEEAGMSVYTAEEYRQRRLAEVDRAAATGHVPAALLSRWERGLEEAGSWRFVPCLVHGDLAPENVLVDPVGGAEVTGVLDWAQASVADPADDFAWLVSGCPDGVVESVLAGYAAARGREPDPALLRRARLASELALARWLLHGVSGKDESVVADAVSMLDDLAAAMPAATW